MKHVFLCTYIIKSGPGQRIKDVMERNDRLGERKDPGTEELT